MPSLPLPWVAKHRSLEEAQAEDELATVELSLAQKQAAIKRLKAAGLSPRAFSFNWTAIRAWLRSH